MDKRVTRESFACATCNKQCFRCPAGIKNKRGLVFCSRSCHYRGRSVGLVERIVVKPYVITEAARAAWREGAKKTRATRIANGSYRKSPETLAKMSAATALRLAATRGQRTSSGIELRVAAELQHFGISFMPQVPFRSPNGTFWGVADFQLSNGVVVEVNGTYWHADPRVYNAHNSTQEISVNRYNRKLKMYKERGIVWTEIWEIEIRKDARQAVRDMLAAIGVVPVSGLS